MKSALYLILLTLIILAILYFTKFNTPNNAIKDKHDVINTVSLQPSNNQTNTSKEKNNNPKDAKGIQIFDESIESQKTNKKDEKSEDKELDFVSAYRDWDYFANCYTDVEDYHNEKDPLLTLSERFANNPRESQFEPTPQQNSYYQHHVELCKSLTDDENDSYNTIRQKLKTRYEKITPKTDQAKQLAHALEMLNQLKVFQLQLSRSYYSKSNLSTNELNSINAQIDQLTTQSFNIYETSDNLSEQDVALIKQYNEQINALRIKIKNSETQDSDAIKQAKAIIDGQLNSMDDYLKHVQSPDAFLLLAQIIYRAEYYQKNSTVVNNMMQQTSITDPYYINILNPIVLPLVACSMNYPCDPESDIMLSYCLGLRDSMFNQACGSTVEDFFFGFYIGANQLNDVNHYFNFLVNKYAR